MNSEEGVGGTAQCAHRAKWHQHLLLETNQLGLVIKCLFVLSVTCHNSNPQVPSLAVK
jgi:hypothetical protein